MNILVEHVKKELACGDFKRANEANYTLYEYDMSRAKSKVEEKNAAKEFWYRWEIWFEGGYDGKRRLK